MGQLKTHEHLTFDLTCQSRCKEIPTRVPLTQIMITDPEESFPEKEMKSVWAVQVLVGDGAVCGQGRPEFPGPLQSSSSEAVRLWLA